MEVQWRCNGDATEVQWRCNGDAMEMQRRCNGCQRYDKTRALKQGMMQELLTERVRLR